MFTRPTKQSTDRSKALHSNRLQIQTKLEVGQPGDKYEKQADAVADKVMMMPEEEEKVSMMPEEEEKVSMMPEEEEKVSMMPEEEEKVNMMPEDEEVQMKPERQGWRNGKSYAPADLAATLKGTKGSGQSLPNKTQKELGGKMNANFSGVKVHTDNNAVQMNQELGSKAFAHGNDIYFNKGNYSPGSNAGKRLLAHELTHTIQQGNNISPKIQRNGGGKVYMYSIYSSNGKKSVGITDDQIKTTVEYKDYIKYWSSRGMDEAKALDACRRILQKFDAGIRGREANYITSGREALAAGKGAPVVPPVPPPPVVVTVPTNVRGSDSPAGMNDRIPPRVDTDATVTVSGLTIPMRDITLSIEGAGGGNGTATIDGAASTNVGNGTHTVKLQGVNQTDVGKANNLKLTAHQGAAKLASSNSFSISSIPQDWNMSFVSLITGARRGIVVQDGWESDSGVVADLNDAEISEEVQYDAGTGIFAGVGVNNSGYQAADTFTQDRHSAPVGLLTGPGSIVAHQTCKFKDNRSGSNDIPMRNSGYDITRTSFTALGTISLTTSKVGTATTANGTASAAGVGSVTRTQLV